MDVLLNDPGLVPGKGRDDLAVDVGIENGRGRRVPQRMEGQCPQVPAPAGIGLANQSVLDPGR